MKGPSRLLALFALLSVVAGCEGSQDSPPPPSATDASMQLEKTTALTVQGPFWPTYHGATTLDGVADIALGDELRLVWTYDADAAVAHPPVTGPDRVCFADGKGVLHALDWKGQEAWSKTFTRFSAAQKRDVPQDFAAPLALFDSTLMACTASGAIYALDVADGNIQWSLDTGWPILGTPNLWQDSTDDTTRNRLFLIDQSDGILHCLDFTSGAKLWTAEGVGRCDGSPSVSKDWVVFGSCACAIHIFEPSSSKMVREVLLGEESQVAHGVVISGDSMFSSTRSGQFVHADARTGAIVWENTDCEAESFGTPAVNDDTVVFTANDRTVYALERTTGHLKWKRALPATPTSPIIARDKIVVSAGGALFMLRLSDGEVLWTYSVSDLITSPSIAGNMVLVGSDDGTITAFVSH